MVTKSKPKDNQSEIVREAVRCHQPIISLLCFCLFSIKVFPRTPVGGELSTTSGFGAALFKLIFALIKLLN